MASDALLPGVLFYCIAPTQRHARCAELILQHGAVVDNIDNNGTPVLVHACETANENELLCLMMLEKGADPNCKDVVSGSRTFWPTVPFICSLFLLNLSVTL